MPKSLVIVESNAKTKTINKFLGKNYIVVSSIGHIKDLPKGKLGVDLIDSYEPNYVTIRGKGSILNELKKAASNSDAVYLATDPDREGEAIAWHIYEEIKPKVKKIHRILFNEITENAVVKAIQNPLTIDKNKVEAQKARRVLDRLVGYQVSPILWNTIYKGLSAGRVQSVALRLIVEREIEIEKFVAREYWTITAELKGSNTNSFLSKLARIDKAKPEISDEKECLGLVDDIKTKTFIIDKIRKKEVKRNPAPPFTTSTLQQEAAKRLGYSSKQIMMIAQQLYEGIEIGTEGSVGLITYMRTDSTRIASEAIQAVREYILNSYGKEYLPGRPIVYKTKKGAQDAHEAIRPTSTERSPKTLKKFLSKEQYKLYQLIWNRFIACQMAPARMDQTSIEILAKDGPSPVVYLFRTTGSIITFRGFLQVYEDFKEEKNDDDDDDNSIKIPDNLKEGAILDLLDLIPKQHFTKPPARYSESSLIKELDNLGIGRPSTYALIISTLLQRKYIERLSRQLSPTELGRTVNKLLIQNFPDIFNVKFTALMEQELDQIEDGDKEYFSVINEFYQPFNKAISEVDSRKEEIKESLMEETEEKCPKCGASLIVRWGRNGKFIGCSGYPECKYTKPIEGEVEETGTQCEKCGRSMIVKVGRFGRFLACSGYPECHNSKPYKIGVACPKEGCNGEIIERKSRRGKVFYGCSNYPKCDFVSWNRPVNITCPNCNAKYLEDRYSAKDGEHLYCPRCKSKYGKEDFTESIPAI